MACKVIYDYDKDGNRRLACYGHPSSKIIVKNKRISDRDWDIQKALFRGIHPKSRTHINLGGNSGNRHGVTQRFRMEEVHKPFWLWQGNIHTERPNEVGIRQPTVKYPDAAFMLDESKYGRLWRLDFSWRINNWDSQRRTIVVLNVWNATKEKDGTRQAFTLRVPQTMRSSHEAVAWTFDLRAGQYSPLKES